MSYRSTYAGLWIAENSMRHPGRALLVLGLMGIGRLLRLTWWILRQAWHRPVAASVVCASLYVQLEVGRVMALATFAMLTSAAVTFKVRGFAAGWGGATHPGRILSDLSSLGWRSWRMRRSWAFAAANVKLLHQAAQEPPRLHRVKWHSPTRVSAVVNLSGTGKSIEFLTSDVLTTLASELKLRRITVEPVKGKPGLVVFTFHWGSALDDVLGLEKLPTPVPGMAMFGITDDDRPIGLYLNLHTLIVGASRSGKSSTVWAMVTSALEQAKRPDGEPVQFWVIDQSQTEFAAIKPLAYKYAAGQNLGIGLLKELVDELADRAKMMGDDSLRVLKPTVERPRIILIIDELLLLVSTKLEPKMGKAADRYVFMLLTQGAKYGIHLWCGTQASKIKVVGDNRDLFQQRLCHKSSHREMTDCALGDKANAQGAECHKLEVPLEAGIGWTKEAERSGYRQFRSVYVEDADAVQIGQGRFPARLLVARGETPSEDNRPGAVYTMWSRPDENGYEECLYIGQTCEDDPMDRWGDHLFGRNGQVLSTTKPWAGEVGRVEVKDCGTQRRARRFERVQIRKKNPKYNDVRYTTMTEGERR